jgi:DNA gyrase subunit B
VKTSSIQQTTANSAIYDASTIHVLRGLEAVRRRPAMYIGSTDAQGVRSLINEVLQNSIDEVMMGCCRNISLAAHSDGSYEVADDGRGIPVDLHHESGRSACEVVLTTLHSGSKFGAGPYQASGGLYGVGLSCVNALSAWLEVDVFRDGKHHRARFARGAIVAPLEVIGATKRHGTIVRFLPDPEIFAAVEHSGLRESFARHLQAQAFLNPGLKISLVDHLTNEAVEYEYIGGIAGFVAELNGSRSLVHAVPMRINGGADGVEVDLAMQWTHSYSENVQLYVNGIHTPHGGAHAEGLSRAMTSAINRYAAERSLLDGVLGETLSWPDISEGLTAVLALRMDEPEFDGTTKTYLSSSRAGRVVANIVDEKLTACFFADPTAAANIIVRAREAARARAASRRASQRARYRPRDFRIDHEAYRVQFGERSKNWHESARWITDKGILETHALACRVPEDTIVLDTCCGSGVVGAAFRGRVAKIVGLDITPQMAALARERLDEVVLGDVYQIPFPEASFGLVCNREVLHLLPEPHRPIAEMYRVLKPGGQIVIGQWVPYGPIDAAWMFRIVKKKQPLFVNNLMAQDLVELLGKAGFVDITQTEYLQWEDIDNWIDSWETPVMQRHEIRELYHRAPAEIREVHPFEISASGQIRDLWRWCIFSAFKPPVRAP